MSIDSLYMDEVIYEQLEFQLEEVELNNTEEDDDQGI